MFIFYILLVLTGNFLSYVVNFGNFMAGNFLGGNFLGRIRHIHLANVGMLKVNVLITSFAYKDMMSPYDIVVTSYSMRR